MTSDGRPRIDRLTTGVPGLDAILAGGIPSGSLTLIAGGPGSGKSTLALQTVFHQGHLGNRSVFFITILEPAVKFLRFAQQFDFFDASLVNRAVFLRDLSDPALSDHPERALDVVLQHIRDQQPSLLVVDSFKALRDRLARQEVSDALLYNLVVELGVAHVTSLLIGEYDEHDLTHLPEAFAADAIIELSTMPEGLREARCLKIRKLRGSSYRSGTHFFDITSGGIVAYPRVSVPAESAAPPSRREARRLSTGVPGLDAMLGGGIPARTVTLIEGGTGTGKSLLGLTFLVEGARRGEPALLVAMEEGREQLLEMAAGRGWDLEPLEQQGLLRILCIPPIDASPDGLLHQVNEAVDQMGAQRVVVDSLTSLQMSIAAEGRFRALVYAIGRTVRARGVTAIMTSETPELVGTATLSGRGPSSIADNVIMLRYVEIESRLVKAIAVLKMRASPHQHILREMEISGDAINVLGPFEQWRGVLTGIPTSAVGQRGPDQRRETDTPG